MSEGKIEVQLHLQQRLGKQVSENTSPESYGKVYDEFHNYILEHRVRGKEANGYIYKPTLSKTDKVSLKLIGHGKKVLDLGCGEGTLAIECARNHNNVTGLDVSKVAIDIAKSKKGDIPVQFEVGDIRKLPFAEGTFDVVICKDVIEHLPESELGSHLVEVNRVLKPGGFYIIYTPTKLLGDLSPGLHLSGYSLSDLVPILKKNGFTAEIVCHWLSLFGPIIKIRKRLPVSILLNYESFIEKMKLGRLVSKWGIFSFIIVPTVWISAIKGPITLLYILVSLLLFDLMFPIDTMLPIEGF